MPLDTTESTPNGGENPALAIENTVDSVRQAYRVRARVVEVDVQLTPDSRLTLFHDDFLSDYTWVHALTLAQLQQRRPFVPELSQVLKVARYFNQKVGDGLGGILNIELNALLCDPGDDLEQTLVSAVVPEVEKADMTGPVIFDSFSPALLDLMTQAAPEMLRERDFSGLQLLTPAQITGVTGLPVTIINRRTRSGLPGLKLGSCTACRVCFGRAVSGHQDCRTGSCGGRRDGLLRSSSSRAAAPLSWRRLTR